MKPVSADEESTAPRPCSLRKGSPVTVKVVTDSTADIPENIARDLGIEVLPVNVVLDGKTYKDGVDINIMQFYENYEKYESMHTEPIPYQDYALKFMQLTAQCDEMLIVHCSDALSENYKTALKVNQEFSSHKCKVEIIDYKTDAVAANRKAVSLAKILYTEGQTDFLSVLDAQRSLYTAQQALIFLRLGKLANQVRLYAVLGGGSDQPVLHQSGS